MVFSVPINGGKPSTKLDRKTRILSQELMVISFRYLVGKARHFTNNYSELVGISNTIEFNRLLAYNPTLKQVQAIHRSYFSNQKEELIDKLKAYELSPNLQTYDPEKVKSIDVMGVDEDGFLFFRSFKIVQQLCGHLLLVTP